MINPSGRGHHQRLDATRASLLAEDAPLRPRVVEGAPATDGIDRMLPWHLCPFMASMQHVICNSSNDFHDLASSVTFIETLGLAARAKENWEQHCSKVLKLSSREMDAAHHAAKARLSWHQRFQLTSVPFMA